MAAVEEVHRLVEEVGRCKVVVQEYRQAVEEVAARIAAGSPKAQEVPGEEVHHHILLDRNLGIRRSHHNSDLEVVGEVLAVAMAQRHFQVRHHTHLRNCRCHPCWPMGLLQIRHHGCHSRSAAGLAVAMELLRQMLVAVPMVENPHLHRKSRLDPMYLVLLRCDQLDLRTGCRRALA